VGKRYLDLPFLLLARLGTLAKVITTNQEGSDPKESKGNYF